MSVQVTYFVHGTTTDNENNISSGWNDVQLSALGVEQSEKLRELTEGITFDIIYCSDCDHSLAGQTVPMEKLD